MPSAPKARSRLLALLAIVLALPACERQATLYPASTPDEALDSAQQMIATGEADRLTDLVYADSEQMRSFLNQVGSMLAALQDLGTTVEQKFPEELAGFRADAEKAAAEGRTNPLFARLVSARRGTSRNPGFGISQIDREGLTLDTGTAAPSRSNPLAPRQSESQRKIVNGIIKQLLADPYRWLEDGRDNLDTVYIADDTVALTWNDRPILPPFGLSMIEEDGRWYLVPPTSYPGVSMIMPRNGDEWFVWGSMVKTLERVVIDLESDLRAGKIRNMTDLADSAAEKVAIPAMLVFFAYGNMVEERTREAEKRSAETDQATDAEPADANGTSPATDRSVDPSPDPNEEDPSSAVNDPDPAPAQEIPPP